MINKSILTNIIATGFIVAAFLLNEPYKTHFLNIGLYSLSGALTNWLAVYMLFEKVPLLYGSGVIPARFEDFKKGIRDLIMDQFFTKENINNFFDNTNKNSVEKRYNFDSIIDKADFSPAFDGMAKVIMNSFFGKILNIFGGKSAIEPLKEPFLEKMRCSIIEITRDDDFQKSINKKFSYSMSTSEIYIKLEKLVQQRLDELTPKMVKEIIQKMIREHLGWLVVWGGVFGGIIGFLVSFIKLI